MPRQNENTRDDLLQAEREHELENLLLPKVKRGAISGYRNQNSYAVFPGYGKKLCAGRVSALKSASE